MNQERKANSSLIRILWAVIKQQKPATASTSKIVKFLMTEGGLTETEAEDAVKDAVEDGLLEVNSNSSTPARNARKSPTRTYRIPSEVGVSIADLDHDLYCFECHSPGNLQKCSLCPRVFHEHCTPTNANSSSTNKRGQSPQNQQPVTTNDTTTESVEESVSQMETTVNEADIEEQQPPAEHVEEKPSFKREVASSTEDIRIQRLLSQNSETKDVMCMGEVRPPSRRTRRVLSTYEKLDASALDTDENQDNVMLCTSCRLYRTQSDPVIEAEEKNYLLKFIFTRIKTWITADTYSPLPFSSSIPMPSKQEFELFEKKCLKFPKTLDYIDKKLKSDGYSSLTEFQCDIMDIQHSVGVVYGVQSDEYYACVYLLSDCAFELSEIRKCADCYRHSNEKSNEYWFCKPCVPRHELVFAKQIGYSHWPAKVIKLENNRYDVRFFGSQHLRANIDAVYVLPIDTDIKSLKVKKTVSFNKAMEELEIHQELSKWPPGQFSYEAERKHPVDLSGIHSIWQNQKRKPGKGKKSAQNSVNREADTSSEVWNTSLNSTTMTTASTTTGEIASPLQSHTTPNNRGGKRRKNNSSATESSIHSVADMIANKKSKPNANSTPLKKRMNAKGKPNMARQKSANGNDLNKRSDVEDPTQQVPVSQTNGEESEVSSTQDHSSRPTSKPNTPARIKSNLGKPKQDIVETLLRDLQALKCPPAACKLATQTLQAEIERAAERNKQLIEKHNRAIAVIKKKQWCYYCGKEAIYHCCWNTAYCSTECQQEHWQMEHKKACRRDRRKAD